MQCQGCWLKALPGRGRDAHPLRRALPDKGLAVNHVLKRYRVKATNPIGYVAEHFGGNGLLYLPILSGKSCRAVLKQVV